jgi:glycosyltransferase involved in cell wall biosynthesis
VTSAAAAPLRVLFIAPVEPWNRENGSSVIIADQLEGLARVGGSEILPVFLRRPPPGLTGRAPTGLEGVQLGLEGVPRWLSIAKAVALRSSPIRLRFDNRMVVRHVQRVIDERDFRPDIVHVEHLPLIDLGATIARRFDCPLVYRSHNIEAQLLARRLGMGGPVARTLMRFAARGEAQASQVSDLTLCISETDLAWVRAHAPAAAAALFPCALLMERYDAIQPERTPVPQIGFAGGLDWAPNEAGLRWFVENVFPHVVRVLPAARLAVLARGAAARPWLAGNPNIQILDDRSDARALFASSWVSIAPLLQGGGVRIKIPESLAVGCPVVATSIGAEGHNLPGLTRSDDAAGFARSCLEQLTVPGSTQSRARLRAAVEARHGATVLARMLLDSWRGLRARRVRVA